MSAARQHHGQPGRLDLAPFDHPARTRGKALGWTTSGPRELIGLSVIDARRHLAVQGITGAGKTTWLILYIIGEVLAGRGVAVIDIQGDLTRLLLERLPAWCGRRLVLLDPAEHLAPATYNPLTEGILATVGVTGHTGFPTPGGNPVHNPSRPPLDRVARAGAARAADSLTAVMRQLAPSWGQRMDDLMRGACLTLAGYPGAGLPDVLTLLTDAGFRRNVISACPPGPVLGSLWAEWDAYSAAQRAALGAPLVARLRAVLVRDFARDLLGAPAATLNLDEILDGGILLARLPKGELGTDTAVMLGSLLVSGLWAATTRRATRTADERPDASVIVDEAHNFLRLPIGVDEALAESRGYRVSWVLAHQHLDQLTPTVRAAIQANTRNKILFTVSAADAADLVEHVAPRFTAHDLSARPAYQVTARIVQDGRELAPFTLNTDPLPPPVAGRSEALRVAARACSGLTAAARGDLDRKRTAARSTLTQASPDNALGASRAPGGGPDRSLGPLRHGWGSVASDRAYPHAVRTEWS